jgi:hypothetical protein
MELDSASILLHLRRFASTKPSLITIDPAFALIGRKIVDAAINLPS